MQLSLLKFAIEGVTTWARGNRPNKLNPLNPAVLRELESIVGRVEKERWE